MRKVHYLFLSSLLVLVYSCTDSNKKNTEQPSPRIKGLSSIISPKNGAEVKLGDPVPFALELSTMDVKIDSFIILDYKNNSFRSVAKHFELSRYSYSVGKKQFSIKVYLSNQKVENRSVNVTMLSDMEPKQYTYQIVNQHPHDPEAFTQGLLIEGGVLYESTGQKGNSDVRITNMMTGKVNKKFDLDSRYFGEGIAVFKNFIYMLTWTAREGMIFDKNTLTFVKSFNYPTQGWGITNKNDTLVMSDGTENLYFMEPLGFSEVKRIQVYDHNGPIDNLNELEYFKDRIYANRWMTDDVYEIDPVSGRVTGVIDLSGLIDQSDYKHELDVLNGIAYDHETQKIFVTGKYWPTLFEIEFIIKPNNI